MLIVVFGGKDQGMSYEFRGFLIFESGQVHTTGATTWKLPSVLAFRHVNYLKVR